MHTAVNVEQYMHLYIIVLWDTVAMGILMGKCNLQSLLFVNIHCQFHDVYLQTICMCSWVYTI